MVSAQIGTSCYPLTLGESRIKSMVVRVVRTVITRLLLLIFVVACAKKLTEEDALETFWPAFKAFDRNRDARIDAEEIGFAMEYMTDDEEIQEMIRALGFADINGDLRISFPEFAEMVAAAADDSEL